jgi:hypothetical protein
MKTLRTLLVLFTAAAFTYAKSESFTISGDTAVSTNLEVPENTTWIIKPGTTIKFSGYCKFVVRGQLIAQGSADAPILFTCTGRPRGAIQPPCWYGVLVMGKKSNAFFRHCRFEGAYRNLAWESSPSFDSCEFAGNHFGLYCTKKASPRVGRCQFYRNVYAVVADFATPLLLNNVITDNTIGFLIQVGSQPIAGPNTIFGNKTDVKTEQCLKGDSTAFSVRYLWELMNELY